MEQYSNHRFREICEDYIHNEKYRFILIRKYCDDITFENLAEEVNLSVSQVKRIVYKYGMEVFRIMEKNRN